MYTVRQIRQLGGGKPAKEQKFCCCCNFFFFLIEKLPKPCPKSIYLPARCVCIVRHGGSGGTPLWPSSCGILPSGTPGSGRVPWVAGAGWGIWRFAGGCTGGRVSWLAVACWPLRIWGLWSSVMWPLGWRSGCIVWPLGWRSGCVVCKMVNIKINNCN